MIKIEEIWRDIVFTDLDGRYYDYCGTYQVSNMGRVKKVKMRKARSKTVGYFLQEKILSPTTTDSGYLRIGLTDREGKRKWFAVHRLVAFMFLDYPNIPLDETPQVNHKDEVKTNNRVDNLEWLSAKENCNYGTRVERAREKLKGRTFTEEQIQRMREAQVNRPKEHFPRGAKHHSSRKIVGVNVKTGEIVELSSIAEANEYFNSKTAKASIGNQLRGKCKTSLGYTWYYKEDYDKLN